MTHFKECRSAVLRSGPRRETDEWIWSRYCLELKINRHVPDFIDDDTVSEHLQHVRRNIRLDFFEN